MTFRHWKPSEDLLLSVAWEEGLPTAEIAADLKRTHQSILGRARTLKLRRPVAWSEAQLAMLRAEYGKRGVQTRELAVRLGKTIYQLKNRVHKEKLTHYKRWSPAERKILRANYGKVDAIVIAKVLGRTRGECHQQAGKLGLYRFPRIPESQIERVKKLYAKGLSDGQIAERLRIAKSRADHIRTTYIGKPANIDPTAKRRGVEKQLKTLGLTSPTQLRTRAFRLFAIESGWPEDLRPREVQILNVLASRGVPMTRFEIAEALKMKASLGSNGYMKALASCNGPGGTYTASLARRGLVIELRNSGPATKTTGKGCGRKQSLYTLGPSALAILQERANESTAKRAG